LCFLGDVMFFKGLVVFLEEICVLLREGDACVHYGKPVMFLKVFLRK